MKLVFLYTLNLLFFVSSFLYGQSTEKEIIRDWFSIEQKFDVKIDRKQPFKISAQIKVESDDPATWGGFYFEINNNEGEEKGKSDQIRIVSNEWKKYELEGVFENRSESIEFGGFLVYNGKFFMDDFQFSIKNGEGIFEQIDVKNSNFESPLSKNKTPYDWNHGFSSNGEEVKVKGFDISLSTDHKEGDYSVMIEGKGIDSSPLDINAEGDSPQITAMISMLENLKNRVERAVKNLSLHELDHLHDDKANRIGALIMHLAAAEAYYQVFTFEGRTFNEEEDKKWGIALDLDEAGRNQFKGHDVQYYLEIYNEVRAKTIEELKKRNDEWFKEVHPAYNVSNHYCWFHVMEHQSSHLGQILFLKKRIPPEPKLEIKPKIKG